MPLLSDGVAFWLGAKEAGVNSLFQAQQFIASGGHLPPLDHQYLLEYHSTQRLYYFDPMEKERCPVAERTHKGYLVVASFFDLMVQKFGFPRYWQLCLTTNKERFKEDFSAILGVPFAEIIEEWKTTVSPPKPKPF